MTIIIFIIILGLLVLVHELGHFVFAKKAGVQVDEFGFGYPPRALTLGTRWGTRFSLNWIPFGGFVKILGENYEDNSPQPSLTTREGAEKRFTQVSKKWQAAILVAGVTFNLLFAWLLFTLGFALGMPTPVENTFNLPVENPMVTIVSVLPGSPADLVGLKGGDKIIEVRNSIKEMAPAINKSLSTEDVSRIIDRSKDSVDIKIERGSKSQTFSVVPVDGIVEGKKVVGIDMDMVGTLSLPLHKAVWTAGKTTLQITYLTAQGIGRLLYDLVRGHPDISHVTGPVGIVGLVGDATRLGFAYLVSFTALISINLAVINLLPLPALDGGRLLFVVIEAITKRSINSKIASTINTISFALLIILMIFITYRDILKLF